MAKKVRVFGTPSCPYCDYAKEFLKEHKVSFEYVDVSKDKEKAMEMIELSGQMGVPVIQVDDRVIVGFDQRALKEALELE